MRTLVTPIHTEAIGLGNLRFFAPPSGGREFPWSSLDDAMHCFSLPRALRQSATKDLLAEYRDQTAVVRTPNGDVRLITHSWAQGLVGAMVDVGRADPKMNWIYAKAAAEALGQMVAGLSTHEVMQYMADAMQASGGAA